jgi:hypothetical protein
MILAGPAARSRLEAADGAESARRRSISSTEVVAASIEIWA